MEKSDEVLEIILKIFEDDAEYLESGLGNVINLKKKLAGVNILTLSKKQFHN